MSHYTNTSFSYCKRLYLCKVFDSPPVIFKAEPWGAIQKHLFFSFSPFMASDIVQMAACSLSERCRTGTMQGKMSTGLKKPFRVLAAPCFSSGRMRARERRAKATVRAVTVIIQKPYISLNWITHISSLYQLGTFQRTYKRFDRNVNRISSCSFYSSLSPLTSELSHPQLLA